MNFFTAGVGKSVHSPNKSGSIFAGNLPALHNGALKSAQEKAERQQKASNEIAFWEKQKENLKSRECDTVEEIAEKLNAFHSYEDQIAAVKTAYNNEQMAHILDEAQEQGEKNAEAAKKLEPKTPEERREEMAEEALGTEEDKGVLDEMLDESLEAAEENLEEQEKLLESQEELLEEAREQTLEEGVQDFQEKSLEAAAKEAKELAEDARAIREQVLESYNRAQGLEREKYRKGWDFQA